MDNLLALTAGPLRLTLAPQVGGCIARFDCIANGRVTPILRGCDSPARALDAGCFPLVPYVNRIRGGRFAFRGCTVELQPNMAGDPSPLHGQGWLSPWTIETADSETVTLAFVHDAGEWPWSYEARQTVSLSDSRLDVTLSCRNLSDAPMPCGLGQHPYFPCTPATRLDTGVAHVWTVDENVLPVERLPAAGRYALDGGSICGRNLDNGYDGWTGVARIHTPGEGLRIALSSPDAHFFQLYSPTEGGMFVAEPVTHANAALNEPEARWEALGLRVLDPGQSMSLRMRIAVDFPLA